MIWLVFVCTCVFVSLQLSLDTMEKEFDKRTETYEKIVDDKAALFTELASLKQTLSGLQKKVNGHMCSSLCSHHAWSHLMIRVPMYNEL